MNRTFWVIAALVSMLVGGVLGSATTAEEATRVRIVNGLGRWNIHDVYISPSSSDNWGENDLVSGQILRAGESITRTVDPGDYDLKCEDNEEDEYTRYEVCIPRGMLVEWRVTLDDLDD